MANGIQEQVFIESSIETMDTAVFNFLKNDLQLYTEKQGEQHRVPILWSSAERAFQIKKAKELRDNGETLIYPLLTVYRETIERDNETFPFTPGSNNFPIARRILPVQTQKFANARANKKFGVNNRKFNNKKVVYETLFSNNVISVLAKYNITIRTNYLTDMNKILNAFITANNFRGIKLENEGHTYYLTIPDQFNFDKISETLDTEERFFETSFMLETRGALFPRVENIDEAVIKTSQNAVNIKFNKERTIVGEKPQISGAKSFVEE